MNKIELELVIDFAEENFQSPFLQIVFRSLHYNLFTSSLMLLSLDTLLPASVTTWVKSWKKYVLMIR
jgi:hypothetical protein